MKGIIGTIVLVFSLLVFQEGFAFRAWLFVVQNFCCIDICRNLLQADDIKKEEFSNNLTPNIFRSFQLLPLSLFNMVFYIFEPLKWIGCIWNLIFIVCCGLQIYKYRGSERKNAVLWLIFLAVITGVLLIRGMPNQFYL